MGQAKVIIGVALAGLVIIASFALFTVDERKRLFCSVWVKL